MQTADPRVYVSLRELVALQARATGFSLLPRQPLRSPLAGRHGSRLRGRGLDFDELRHYRPGDDIRALDWKVTRRTGKPHVRCYREEREREALLLVDQRTGMFFGSRERMKSVVAAQFAALAAWRVFDSGDRVGALLFGDSGIVELQPRRRRSAVLQLLGELRRLNHELRAGAPSRAAPDSLNRVLREAERLARHDCLLVLVSDFDGWDEETLARMQRIARHNDVVAALVSDPLEQRLPPASRLVVSDGELQIQVDTRAPRLQSSYAEQFSGALQTLRSALHRHAVPVIELDTERPVDSQLREALGHAGQRG